MIRTRYKIIFEIEETGGIWLWIKNQFGVSAHGRCFDSNLDVIDVQKIIKDAVDNAIADVEKQ